LIDLRDQSDNHWNAPRTPWSGEAETVGIDLTLDENVDAVLIASPEDPRARELAFKTTATGIHVESPIAGPWTSVVVR
jgi:hypothetical protein